MIESLYIPLYKTLYMTVNEAFEHMSMRKLELINADKGHCHNVFLITIQMLNSKQGGRSNYNQQYKITPPCRSFAWSGEPHGSPDHKFTLLWI